MKLNFFSKLAIFTGLIGAVLYLSQLFVDNFNPGNTIWGALVFYVILTAAIYKMTAANLKKKGNQAFLYSVFGGMGLRIFLCVAFLVLYLISTPEKNNHFVFSFLALYLLFTIFEIYHLVTKLRAENKETA